MWYKSIFDEWVNSGFEYSPICRFSILCKKDLTEISHNMFRLSTLKLFSVFYQMQKFILDSYPRSMSECI